MSKPEVLLDLRDFREDFIRTLWTRRVTIVAFMLVAPAVRVIFDIPLSWRVPLGLAVWLLLTFPVARLIINARTFTKAYWMEFGFFVFELLYISWIIWEIGGMGWLGGFMYVFTITYSNVFLSRREGLIITALASALAVTMGLSELRGWIPVREFGLPVDQIRQDSRSMIITIFVIPIAGYWIVGYTVGLFGSLLRERAMRALEDERSLRIRASTDSLTGLYNHSHVLNYLAKLVRARRPCAVTMIDIDGFKAINDSSGHYVGDEALRVLAEAMRRSARSGDVLGRYGGDEFLAILPDTDSEGAAAFGRRVLGVVRRCAQERALVTNLDVRASIGVAAYPRDGRRADELIVRADALMYEAKRLGGNRVRLSTVDEAA
jgi:diguanylate cyclase (GGDEF)-like protein